ncbi:YebC/PmpR family DNA-binding transcriptional regulator [Spirochaeta africana]|uniref:Probable transcriptional regulatory protein Spiaf_1554 n=1 Tax=Spirochaeta africana (strain ATCC 700263 / DSM 8902 / Z-7692) TaxID=889378 RepID=H9UJC0_SPIAZ|nr:YebC/PmpR family DNA-binding transcriptional regulator [Spirochaeta africana]AFG37613.1 DNA-binding regulatory protein, YebC/PmpR family [Spirochaeta africana DSM 8902]
MSGHSKWATIRHKKGALDAKRGKIFSKLIKEITVAARLGGGDPDSNPRLRTAINKARAENMPKDNVERAIKKGTGDLEGVDYTEMMYEGYGPGGVAILVDCLTDNKNRTAADVRSIFNKAGGNLGESGCVSYLFNKKGILAYSTGKYTEDQILEPALEAGAADVAVSGDTIEVETAPEDFDAVVEAMEAAGFVHENAEVALVADTNIELDADGTRKVLKMLDALDDHDDVQSVSSNLEIPDDFDFDQ